MTIINLNILVFLIALFMAAFFSSTETAMITISRLKLEIWIKRGIKGADKMEGFLRQPEHFLTTILVGTNIATVTASSIIAVYLKDYLSDFNIIVVSSFFLLIFGEVLPKLFARDKAAAFTRSAVPFLRIFYILFYPINLLTMSVSNLLLRILKSENPNVKKFFSRRDLDILVRESRLTELVDENGIGLISKFILHGNKEVQNIMIPRTEIVTVNADDPVKTVSEIFEKKGFSRLPVMDIDIDHIIGNINAKDVLLKEPKYPKDVLREVLFVPKTKPIGSLLKEMQEKRLWMTIVVGEYGGTAGLVTIEDILEEFFGEIEDEFDEIKRDIEKINSNEYFIKAKVRIEELNKTFNLDFSLGEYQTLGGLIIDKLGYIPKKGEKLKIKNCIFIIRTAFRKKIGWVRMILDEK